MRKIIVLQLVEDLGTGGLEKVIVDIAENLNAEQYKVIVWCVARGGEIADELISKGIDVKILGIRSYYNPFNILRLVNLFKKVNPDILHTHTYFSNTIGRIAAKLTRIPIIITHVQNTYWNYTKRNLFIERLLSYFTDKIICCSDAVKDFVLGYEKISPQKVVTIYNGIALDKFNQSIDVASFRDSLGIRDNELLIATVASLTPKKGHKYFLDSVADIVKTYKNIKCLIVGDGPLRKELEEYVKTLSLDYYIIFTGIRNDIPNLLRAADIFVLPSLIEGLGIAAIEAMASGIPVVATNVGGLSEVVKDGISGILVPPKDSEALSGAIMSLLKDSQAAKQMGDEGHKISREKFSSKMMIRKIEGLYKEYVVKKIK